MIAHAKDFSIRLLPASRTFAILSAAVPVVSRLKPAEMAKTALPHLGLAVRTTGRDGDFIAGMLVVDDPFHEEVFCHLLIFVIEQK